MATCGSLQHIFDSLLPEHPTLLESLSWNQIKSVKSIEPSSSFTEIFGELHFKENPISSTEIDHTKFNQTEDSGSSNTSRTPSSASFSSNRHKSSDSFSSLNSESLQLCTEGLGFESSDDVEDLKSGMSEYWETHNEKESFKKHLTSKDSYGGECRKSRSSSGEYPPPISCIGRTGKPWVCFKSYRSNGRFVLKEIRIPKQEFLHAYREDGRLKLQFVEPDVEFVEEEDEEEEEEDNDDVETIDDEEENMGKENVDCVTRDVNEEKEIEASASD